MVSNVNVLGPGVLDIITAESNGTTIVTIQGNLVEVKAVVSDIGIFVGYAPSRKGYRIYGKRTRRIMEIIHVQFDELTEQMASVHLSTGPAPNLLMPG
nr:integrase, catalytic region, zinc finger, CCHC-type, peptidase aspartic, catalytic [Tanacetum cinerariifolium]